MNDLTIRFATPADLPITLGFIKELAKHLQLTQDDSITEESLHAALFGEPKLAEVIIGWVGSEAVGCALFFQNYSTPLGRPGLYLEDLYIKPHMRGRGFGKRLLIFLAKLAQERGCARFEWSALRADLDAINFYQHSIGAKAVEDWVLFRLTGDALARFAELPS